MAQEPESERNASGIARTSKRKWGYDSEQVDAFLERAHMLYEGEGAQLTQHDIQNVSFDLVKGGYVIAQVGARRGGQADHMGDFAARSCGVESADRKSVPPA